MTPFHVILLIAVAEAMAICILLRIVRRRGQKPGETSAENSAGKNPIHSNRYMQSIFDAIQDGISVLDTELNIVHVNHAMKKWYAHMLPFEGKKCYHVYHGRSQICENCPTVRALKSGRLEVQEVQYIQENKNHGTMELFAFPIVDDAGTLTGVVEFVRDITERKRSEKALKESERRYRDIFSSVSDGMILAETDGEIVDVNPALCTMYGYTREELIGRQPTMLIHPDHHHVFEKFKHQTRQTGTFIGETTDIRKDGTQLLVEAKGSLVHILGKPYIMGIIRDISERKQSEELLKEREILYRSLFENNLSVMLLIDPLTGAIIDANPSACTYYGHTKEELKTLNITDVNTLTKEEVFEEMDRAKHEKRNYFNFRHRRADGSIRDVEVYSGPITVSGRPLLCSIIHDISERKTAEKERERLIDELQKALSEVKTLRGFLPICASCKNIRDDKGYWSGIESYIAAHSEAEFSHSICPACVKKLYPDLKFKGHGPGD